MLFIEGGKIRMAYQGNLLIKTLVVGVILLFVGAAVQPSIATVQPEEEINDVEIEIYAGQFVKKDIGIGISIYVRNHKTKNITLNIKKETDYIFRDNRDWTYERNYTILPGESWHLFMTGGGFGFKYITITVNSEGTIVTRNGINIRPITIFTD